MMKKLFFFIATAMLFVSCADDDGVLPLQTREGNGTIGCTVNGKVFRGSNTKYSSFKVSYNEKDKSLYIFRNGYIDGLPLNCSIAIMTYPISEVGKVNVLNEKVSIEDSHRPSYHLGNYGIFSYSQGMQNILKPFDEGGSTSAEHTGEVIITRLDTIRKIISGRFRFDVETETFGVVKIRDGRFDYNYGKK